MHENSSNLVNETEGMRKLLPSHRLRATFTSLARSKQFEFSPVPERTIPFVVLCIHANSEWELRHIACIQQVQLSQAVASCRVLSLCHYVAGFSTNPNWLEKCQSN